MRRRHLEGPFIHRCGRASFIEETLREGNEILEEPLQRGNRLTECAALDQAIRDCFQEVEVAQVRGCNGIAE